MAKIAFVLETDFEDSEFQQPYDKVTQAGHAATVIGTEAGKELTGKQGKSRCTVDTTADQVDVGDFDALVIPGGYSPDKLRLNDDMVGFTRKMMGSGKPVAAICHAGQLLVEAGVVEGRRMTSWPSVRKELELAGADWVDQEVVEDGNLITSRNPDDLPAFCDALLARLE
jgi:protease I